MIVGELKCKYCGATLVVFDGDKTIIQNVVVDENYVFCENCKNVLKSDILYSLFGLNTVVTSVDKNLTVDKLYERLEEEEEVLKEFEKLPKVSKEFVVKRVFIDSNKVYENCVFVVGQIRDCTNLMIKDSVIVVPASAMLQCYPLIENCENIALVNIEWLILEQFIELPKLLNCLPFDDTILNKLRDLLS